MVTVRLGLQARKGKATVRQELEPGRGLLEKSWSQGGSNFLWPIQGRIQDIQIEGVL